LANGLATAKLGAFLPYTNLRQEDLEHIHVHFAMKDWVTNAFLTQLIEVAMSIYPLWPDSLEETTKFVDQYREYAAEGVSKEELRFYVNDVVEEAPRTPRSEVLDGLAEFEAFFLIDN
jgi:hypothetical protein